METTIISGPARVTHGFVTSHLQTRQQRNRSLAPDPVSNYYWSLPFRLSSTWRYAAATTTSDSTVKSPTIPSGEIGKAGGGGGGGNKVSGPKRIDHQRISYEGQVWYERGTLGRIVFCSRYSNGFSGDIENDWRVFRESTTTLRSLHRKEAHHLIRNVHGILNPHDEIPYSSSGIYQELQKLFNHAYAVGERTGSNETAEGVSIILGQGRTLPITVGNWPKGNSHHVGDVVQAVSMLPRQFLDMVNRLHMSYRQSHEKALIYDDEIKTVFIYKPRERNLLYVNLLQALSYPLFDGGVETQEMLYVLASFADGMDPPDQQGLENIREAIASHAKAMVLVPDRSPAMVHKGWVEFNPAVAHFFLALLSSKEDMAFTPDQVQAAARTAENEL